MASHGSTRPPDPTYGEATGVGEWVAWPEPVCYATAEVVDRYTLPLIEGLVPMVRARCLGKHIRDWADD